jgi:hypothetical protein
MALRKEERHYHPKKSIDRHYDPKKHRIWWMNLSVILVQHQLKGCQGHFRLESQ